MATLPNFYLELDRSGVSSANLVHSEVHILSSNHETKLILPKFGAFYSESIRVYSVDPDTLVATELTRGTQFLATEMLHKVTKLVGKSVCTVVLVLPGVAGNRFEIQYQALGGHDQANREVLLSNVESLRLQNIPVQWSAIANKPEGFLPSAHLHDALDLYGMEYVTDQLDRITYAVTTGDQAIHDKIIDHLESEKEGFFTKYNGEVYARVDTITALTRSAEDTLKLLSVELNTAIDRFEHLKPKVSQLQDAIADYKHLNYNDKEANVANLLCKRKFDLDGSLIDIPLLFDGLQLYLDSTTYNSTSRLWMDKRGNGNGFSAGVGTAPAYGAGYTKPSINSVKFTTGKWMDKVGTLNLNITKGRTVIAVMGHRDSVKQIKMPILTGASKMISIDTGRSIAAQYSALDSSDVSYAGMTSKYLTDSPFVNVINFGTREKDCLNLNNTPYSYYKAPNNILPGSLNLDTIGGEMTRLGHFTLEQDAEVYMLLVYQRELSKVEMHAILTYIRLKYGSNVNYLTNPEFAEDATNYGTDLNNYPDFVNRDSFRVMDKRIHVADPQNVYSDPEYPDPIDIRLTEGKYMHVVSKSPTLNFWNEEVLLDPYTRYEFKYSIVYGLVNPPILRLKINGVWHAKSFTLGGSRSIVRDITYTFVTGANPVNKLELFNLNPATVGNSFGIDKLSLTRLIYAETN